jgi:hypothetical protein
MFRHEGGIVGLNALTQRYLEQLGGGPSSVRSTAAAESSPTLMAAYQGRFLSRPTFLDADELFALTSDLARLHRLLVSVPDRFFDGSLRRYAVSIGLNPTQVEAVLRLSSDRPLPLGRADLYRERDGFKVLEVNLGSPLGGIENAELNRAMLTSPSIARFVAEEGLAYHDTLASIARMLLEHCGLSQAEARPIVAIVDTPASFAKLGRRLHAIARSFSDHGLDAVACDISELRAKGDRLAVCGRVVDVIYRWFVLDDLQSGGYDLELFEPILQAYERGRVAVFTPFDVELYGTKSALAVLSDDCHRDAVGEEDRELVDRLVPWTREIREGTTAVGAEHVDLLDHCRETQADLLLKPSFSYGGQGIRAGWLTSEEDWCRALGDALDQHYVVQRRVRPQPEPFLDERTGAVEDIVLNWGVFLDGNGYGGAYVRGCPDPDVGVVSMESGARFGCCFVQDPSGHAVTWAQR